LNVQNTTSNLKKILDIHHKTLHVAYIKNFHHIMVKCSVIYSIPQEQQVAIVNFLLVKSHEFSKILVKSQSKIPWFTGLEIKVIHYHHCHGLNKMCWKSNTPSLSLSYPPSTVVTSSFRQRNYPIYPKVADFADKNTFKIKYSICISNECNTEFRFLFNLKVIQYLYLPNVFRLVATIHHCKIAFCAL